MIPAPALPQGPPPAAKVEWRKNERRRASRVAAMVSLAMSGGLFAMTAVSMALGDRSLLTLFAFVMSLFLLDGAVTRLLASRKAPLEIGFSDFGLHVRLAAREVVLPWPSVVDIRFASVGPRPDTMTVTVRDQQIMQFTNVLPSIGSEAKLAWLEAGAKARAMQRGVRPRIAGGPGHGLPAELLQSSGPQYWAPQDSQVPQAGSDAGAPPAAVVSAKPSAPLPDVRPEWGYTAYAKGPSQPDPIYHAPAKSVKPLVWHFLPTAATRASAFLLVALVVLAVMAVTRIAADTLLSLGGQPSDPWIANLVGLSAGAILAGAVWRLRRSELSGEVAGSVIFLPAFDRTKGELVGALREAGTALGSGDALERRSRNRLIVQWRSTRTRATIVQAAPDMRAIILRTVGRSHYESHARLKGAILERLKGPDLRK